MLLFEYNGSLLLCFLYIDDSGQTTPCHPSPQRHCRQKSRKMKALRVKERWRSENELERERAGRRKQISKDTSQVTSLMTMGLLGLILSSLKLLLEIRHSSRNTRNALWPCSAPARSEALWG